MGEQARGLAERFERANHEIVTIVERCSDAQWHAKTAGEGWTVGVVAHHVAEAHKGIAGLVERVATGQPLPALTMELFDRQNAEHAKQHAHCTRTETLALLRTNGTAAATTVRGLREDQLGRSASVLTGAPPMTVQQVIERILIGHVQEHLGSIRAATGIQ